MESVAAAGALCVGWAVLVAPGWWSRRSALWVRIPTWLYLVASAIVGTEGVRFSLVSISLTHPTVALFGFFGFLIAFGGFALAWPFAVWLYLNY